MDTKDITLVIGDAHVDPKQRRGLDRFNALHNLILERKPSRLVIIGDFITLDSLSDWDKDKRRRLEGKRYYHDIQVGRDALGRMMGSGFDWKPELIFIEGNHEERLQRYLDRDPSFDGVVSIERDLCPDWKYIPYKSQWKYKGVSFTHIPINEAGKALGGKNACQRSLEIYNNSVVFGHTHKLAVACVHRLSSPHLQQAVNVGCFFDHVDDYATGSVTSYWRGVVLLNHYSFNRMDVETISMGRLRQDYA